MKYLILTLFALIASPAFAHHPETGAHLHFGQIALLWILGLIVAVILLVAVRRLTPSKGSSAVNQNRAMYRGER